MKNESLISKETRTHKLILRERSLASLQAELLAEPITLDRLDQWVSKVDRADRTRLLRNLVWGSIQWQKSLGRPIAPTPAAAFVIEHISYQWVLALSPSGEAREIMVTLKHPEPSKWDGPDDDYYHRVSFFCFAQGSHHEISARFSERVSWERRIQMTSGYPRIDPPGIYFQPRDNRIVLEPFVVSHQSLSPLGSNG